MKKKERLRLRNLFIENREKWCFFYKKKDRLFEELKELVGQVISVDGTFYSVSLPNYNRALDYGGDIVFSIVEIYVLSEEDTQ